jgi:hypothetical protein
MTSKDRLSSAGKSFKTHIGECVRQSRPSGLLSLVNLWVIVDVFREQSRYWREHAKLNLQRVFQAMTDYVKEALGSLMDPQTCGMLMFKQVGPELERRWRNVEAKLDELLVPVYRAGPEHIRSELRLGT